MARRRTKNKHLPPYVYIKHNAFYFVDRNNQWIRLGNTLAEAMSKWSLLVDASDDIFTMGQLFDRYMLEVAPKKAAATYKTNQMEMQSLRVAFSHMRPREVNAVAIYKFLDARGKSASVRANREKALLSHVFSMAIRWGVVEYNPCRDVKRIPEVKRDRYITHEEFNAVKAIAPQEIKLIMSFAYLTALRQFDILKIKLTDLTDEGIFVHISKTKNKILIQWSDSLRQLVEKAKALSRAPDNVYLFTNTKGRPYTSSGLQTIWQRLMRTAIEDNILTDRFRFHDIRRKAATDIESQFGRETARKLLGHIDQKTTAIYISGVKKVKPLDGEF